MKIDSVKVVVMKMSLKFDHRDRNWPKGELYELNEAIIQWLCGYLYVSLFKAFPTRSKSPNDLLSSALASRRTTKKKQRNL